jgi:hypothetical protein
MRSILRLGNRIAATSRSRIFVIVLLATSGCNSQKSGTPLAQVDLRAFGYGFTDRNQIADATGLSFLSEDRLAVSVNQLTDTESSAPPGRDNPQAHILVIDVQSGRIVEQGTMPVGTSEGAVQWVSGLRLAVWNSKGLQVCALNLRCSPPLAGLGPLSVSPKGTRIAFGGYGMSPIKVLDVEPLREVASFDDPQGQNGFVYGGGVIPGDTALLVRRGPNRFVIRRPGKQDTLMDFERGGSFALSRFLNGETIVYVEHNSNEAIVADLDGRELHRYKLKKAYRTDFLPTASGKRFGIYEYGFTFWNTLLNFFDFEETRPPDFQRVRVIDISSGTEVAGLEWDPRQSPLRHSIEPQLSPSGHRLARVVAGVLEILPVN